MKAKTVDDTLVDLMDEAQKFGNTLGNLEAENPLNILAGTVEEKEEQDSSRKTGL